MMTKLNAGSVELRTWLRRWKCLARPRFAVCCLLFSMLMPDFCQGCSEARDEHGDWHSQVGLHGSGWLVMIRVFMMWTNFANSFPSERSEEEGEREESRPRVRIFLNSVFREYLMILFPENISQFCFSRIFLWIFFDQLEVSITSSSSITINSILSHPHPPN